MATGQMDGDAFVTASKEYAELEPVAIAAKNVRRLRAEIATLEVMARDPHGDAELADMAVEELIDLSFDMAEAEQGLAVTLLPRDSADDRPAMLEIRAGTGGDEAALFAGDLFRMYTRYAEGRAGRSNSSPATAPMSAASRKWSPRSRASACSPN